MERSKITFHNNKKLNKKTKKQNKQTKNKE